MSYYLISVHLPDESEKVEKLADLMAQSDARRISLSEWLLQTDPGQVFCLYDLVASAGDHASFVVQELSEGRVWDNVVVSADIWFDLLRDNSKSEAIDKHSRRAFRSVPYGFDLCERCQGAGRQENRHCPDCFGKGLIPVDVVKRSETA